MDIQHHLQDIDHELAWGNLPSNRSIATGENGVDYVIDVCKNFPIDASVEGIRLRRVVLEHCPLGRQFCPSALDEKLL